MPHTVIRHIGGRAYEYEEESYRIPGVKNPRKRSRYIGPVDAPDVDPVTGKKKRKGLLGKIHDAVRVKQAWEETEEDASARMAEWEKERALIQKNNELLSGRSIKLEEIAEIASSQRSEPAAPETSDRDVPPGDHQDGHSGEPR